MQNGPGADATDRRARRGRTAFRRPLVLRGWSPGSSWGFDEVLECYWAELHPEGRSGAGAGVRIGPEHLVPTVTGLARAVAFAAGTGDAEAYLALTGPGRAGARPASKGGPAGAVLQSRGPAHRPREEIEMGIDDKAKNTGQDWKGKAKEHLGDATDDREMQAEGQQDQSSASLKQAGEKVKDAFRK